MTFILVHSNLINDRQTKKRCEKRKLHISNYENVVTNYKLFLIDKYFYIYLFIFYISV